ncbi:hypothetical protein OSB04_030296, partial [Centaurea solstitialis]
MVFYFRASGAQLVGRAAASPSGASSFDNTTASPLPYANSPRSATNMMNTPSPQQQQTQQQHQQQQQQQQRQRLMQLPQHQQQLLAQQLRQSPMTGLGQNQLSQLHDLQGQAQQKYQLHGQNQMQFSQSLGGQQFQGRQLASGAIQHGIAQSQLNQGNQLTRHLNQMSNTANTALFNAAQATPNNQMVNFEHVSYDALTTLLPRMPQFGLSGANRTLGSQSLNDQVFNMGAANPTTMLPMQQQQQQQQQQLGSQGGFGNMQQNSQNLQPGMVPMQQNHNKTLITFNNIDKTNSDDPKTNF